jgi:hypothetical protein
LGGRSIEGEVVVKSKTSRVGGNLEVEIAGCGGLGGTVKVVAGYGTALLVTRQRAVDKTVHVSGQDTEAELGLGHDHSLFRLVI